MYEVFFIPGVVAILGMVTVLGMVIVPMIITSLWLKGILYSLGLLRFIAATLHNAVGCC